MKITLHLLRVPEIAKGQCFECVLDDAGGETHTCSYIQTAHGGCSDNRCVYIFDTPESIANYTKARITE